MGSAENGGVSIWRPKGAKLVHPPPWEVYATFPKLSGDKRKLSYDKPCQISIASSAMKEERDESKYQKHVVQVFCVVLYGHICQVITPDVEYGTLFWEETHKQDHRL